jgi:hypothetical protein
MLLGTLPAPSAGGVDRLYHLFGEILAIIAALHVECSLEHQDGVSTPSPGRSKAGWQKTIVEASAVGTTSSPAWVSSHGSPQQLVPCVKPWVCHYVGHGDMGAIPKPCAWNPCWGGHNEHEGHNLGPKGLGPKASRSDVHDTRQPPHYWAKNNIVRYTPEELLNITAQYASNEVVAGPLLVPSIREADPGSSQAMPSSIVIQGVKKDAKGSKKR